MIVYHGTSWKHWQGIKKNGLRVRGKSPRSNWTHSIESNPDTVYLTDAYAVYFGLAALSLKGDDTKVVVIEMDTDDLPGRLVPDEDALEQVGRMNRQDGLPEHWGMVQRTRHYRGLTKEYADHGLDFEWSMSVLGTGGHIGNIPASAFRRVAVFDPKEEKALAMMFMDTTVSVNSYSVLGYRWRQVSNMLFNDPIDQPTSELDKHFFGIIPGDLIAGNVSITNLKEF